MHFFFLLFSSFFFKQEKKKEGKRNIIAIVFTGRSVTLTELQFNKECRKKNYFFFLCAYKNSHFYFSGEKWEKLVFPAGEVKLCSKKILRPSYTRMPTFKIVLWLFFFFRCILLKKYAVAFQTPLYCALPIYLITWGIFFLGCC